MNTQYFLNKLVQNQDLTTDESMLLLTEMMQESFTQVQMSSLLTALAMKGETVDEIIGFIQTMREHMITVGNGSRLPARQVKPLPTTNAIDVCGTGGDNKETFNISTAVAFVVAGAGVNVAKHGNRAASSNCGSADVLEKLGVNILINAQQAEEVLQNVGMVFLFAPLFHPTMKSVSTVRKELQMRTVFNFLGSFANPARVKRQLIGVPSISIAEKLAQVGKQLDYAHLLIVTSEDGMDEISISKKTYMYEIKGEQIYRFIINPTEYGFASSSNEKMHGGEAETNAEIIKNILSGEKGPKRDIVVFNSAFALYISGKVKDIREGIKIAEESIDSGAAKQVLEKLIKETQQYA